MSSRVQMKEWQEENKALIGSFFGDGSGSLSKEASNPKLRDWMQTYARNEGQARRLLNPEPVTKDDFIQTDVGRDPYVIRTFVPHSAGAMGAGWQQGTGGMLMNANKYRIYLKRISTPTYYIDKIYLEAYNGPLVDVFKDLMMLDILRKEDLDFRNVVISRMAPKHTVNPLLGIKQWISMGTEITIATVGMALQGMSLAANSGLKPARAWVHNSLWWSIITSAKAYEVTNEVVQKTLFGDTEQLSNKLWGIEWVSSLDRNMVEHNAMYMFAAPEYLGDFLTYEDAQIYTEVKMGKTLYMTAHETAGICIPTPSANACFRADFEGTPESWFE